ncbi:hypothetical protein PR048_004389 [Dryococelus australis]|uniref:Uncharacterized protein n=1 Tax=Dryococelus australis TaxID=614101 RepID=A0ABQ9I6C0_9NEOP|nr:hypothetical protein PR048_004389 [Dryococelus australis]
MLRTIACVGRLVLLTGRCVRASVQASTSSNARCLGGENISCSGHVCQCGVGVKNYRLPQESGEESVHDLRTVMWKGAIYISEHHQHPQALGEGSNLGSRIDAVNEIMRYESWRKISYFKVIVLWRVSRLEPEQLSRSPRTAYLRVVLSELVLCGPRNSGGGCRIETSPEFAASSTPLAELTLRRPDTASSLVQSRKPRSPPLLGRPSFRAHPNTHALPGIRAQSLPQPKSVAYQPTEPREVGKITPACVRKGSSTAMAAARTTHFAAVTLAIRWAARSPHSVSGPWPVVGVAMAMVERMRLACLALLVLGSSHQLTHVLRKAAGSCYYLLLGDNLLRLDNITIRCAQWRRFGNADLLRAGGGGVLMLSHVKRRAGNLWAIPWDYSTRSAFENPKERRAYSPKCEVDRYLRNTSRCEHTGAAVRAQIPFVGQRWLSASHQGEPVSIPGRVTARFFASGNRVPGDVGGRRVFSGISRFPRPCIPALFRSHIIPPSSALTTSMLRATQISPPTHHSWSAGFLGDLQFPYSLHSRAVPYLTSPSSDLKTSMSRAVQISPLHSNGVRGCRRFVASDEAEGKYHRLHEVQECTAPLVEMLRRCVPLIAGNEPHVVNTCFKQNKVYLPALHVFAKHRLPLQRMQVEKSPACLLFPGTIHALSAHTEIHLSFLIREAFFPQSLARRCVTTPTPATDLFNGWQVSSTADSPNNAPRERRLVAATTAHHLGTCHGSWGYACVHQYHTQAVSRAGSVTELRCDHLDNPIIQQGNARPLTARVSLAGLREVNMLPWPARSPDDSPIENFWYQIERQLRPAATNADLEEAVSWCWRGGWLHGLDAGAGGLLLRQQCGHDLLEMHLEVVEAGQHLLVVLVGDLAAVLLAQVLQPQLELLRHGHVLDVGDARYSVQAPAEDAPHQEAVQPVQRLHLVHLAEDVAVGDELVAAAHRQPHQHVEHADDHEQQEEEREDADGD